MLTLYEIDKEENYNKIKSVLYFCDTNNYKSSTRQGQPYPIAKESRTLGILTMGNYIDAK